MSQFKNSTVREMASTSAAELAQEQEYVTMLYERLDVLRAVTEQRLGAVNLGADAQIRENFEQERVPAPPVDDVHLLDACRNGIQGAAHLRDHAARDDTF